MPSIESLLHRRTDLSTFVVHFTRNGPAGSARDNILGILENRRLEARNVYGMAKQISDPEIAATQKVVCLTETPLEHAWMMCEDIDARGMHFSQYGVAFTKAFARRRGANPVWYIDITPGHDWLTVPINAMIDEAERSARSHRSQAADLTQVPILRLTPFFEQMGPMNNGGRKEFWWEREWRIVGDLRFSQDDIVVVFAPENKHESLKEDLADTGKYRDGDTMPALVDPTWGLERMIGAFARVSVDDLGPFPT